MSRQRTSTDIPNGFDRTTVEDVATALMSGGDGGEELPGRRVLINAREMKPNPAIPEAVWEKLLSLPSQSLPKRQSRPVKRLTALAVNFQDVVHSVLSERS